MKVEFHPAAEQELAAAVTLGLRSYSGSMQTYCASSHCRIGDKDRDTGVVGCDR